MLQRILVYQDHHSGQQVLLLIFERMNLTLVYKDLDFKVCTETDGDVFARIQVRLDEMRESMHIIEQCLDQIPSGPIFPENTPYGKRSPIMRVPAGEVFHRVEDPRGEMGFYMVSDGSDKPYRVKDKRTCVSNTSDPAATA